MVHFTKLYFMSKIWVSKGKILSLCRSRPHIILWTSLHSPTLSTGNMQDSTFTASELLIHGTLPEDIINAPTLNTFKARLDKCWSGHKFISTKLDTKRLNRKARTISKTMKEIETLGLLKGPDTFAQWKLLCYVMLCWVILSLIIYVPENPWQWSGQYGTY